MKLRWIKSSWLLQRVAFLAFYCWTTFCNIKFFKYRPLGIFYSGLYSLFLLIKPIAVQHKLSISFRWGTCTFSFFMFKARELHMWIFIFLISPCSSKVLWYQEPFRVSRKFRNMKYPHPKYYASLKVARIRVHLKCQWHRLSERVLLIKSCIEQNITAIYVEGTWNIILQSLKVFIFTVLF